MCGCSGSGGGVPGAGAVISSETSETWILTGEAGAGLEHRLIACGITRASLFSDIDGPLSANIVETRVRVVFSVEGAGIADEQAVEGASLQPALADPGAVIERAAESFAIHFPHYDLQNGGPASAIYRGDYKLIHRYEDGAERLFDLRRDPGERDDLAADKSQIVAKLKRELFAYLRTIDAKLPTANPAYGK